MFVEFEEIVGMDISQEVKTRRLVLNVYSIAAIRPRDDTTTSVSYAVGSQSFTAAVNEPVAAVVSKAEEAAAGGQ